MTARHDPEAHDHEAHDHGLDDEHRHGIGSWLAGLFGGHRHDSAASVDSALETSARGIRAVQISLVGLGLTALLQLAVVFVSASVALLADTIHNFSDALTAVPLWIAFVLGRRAASRRFTFGFRRAEDIAGLFIVAMIAASAGLAAWESVRRLVDPHPIGNVALVAAAGLIGFAGNEAVALYRIRVGREIASAALIADGYHARADGFTSLGVLAAAAGVWLGFPQADPIVGLLITVAILFVLRDAAGQVFGRLMDAVEPELVADVERTAAAVQGVEGVDAVRMRWIGHALEASLHVTVDCERSVADGHRIAEEVRHALFHAVRRLDTVTVHVDPCTHDQRDHHAVTEHHASPVG